MVCISGVQMNPNSVFFGHQKRRIRIRPDGLPKLELSQTILFQTINLAINFSVTDYFTLLDQCNFSHNMDIKTFLVNISIFIKHFFNMALCAIKLCKQQ